MSAISLHSFSILVPPAACKVEWQSWWMRL